MTDERIGGSGFVQIKDDGTQSVGIFVCFFRYLVQYFDADKIMGPVFSSRRRYLLVSLINKQRQGSTEVNSSSKQ